MGWENGFGGVARRAAGYGVWLVLTWLALAAQAQVSWVSNTTVAPATVQGSVNLTRPAGVVFADLLIAQVAVNPSSATVTAPTGWTQVDAVSSGSVKQYLFYRPAQDTSTGAEPASYTFTISPSARVAANVFAVRGAEMIPPIFQAYSSNTGASSTLTANEVTATNNGSFLVALFAQANGNATITPQATLTSKVSATTGAASGISGVAIAAGSETLSAVGPTGTRTALSTSAVNNVSMMFSLRKATQSCFSDGFSSTLNTSDWAATVRNGTFTPQTVSGRLRLTQNAGNQATAVTLQRMIPAAGNQVILNFKHYAYGYSGCAADGIVAVLSDATVTPQPGGYGGSLGYAQYSVGPTPGFSGGWLGVGLDEYGNFSNNSENRTLSPSGWTVPSGVAATSGGTLRADSVIVRGSTPNYYYLAGTSSLSPGVDANTTSTATPLPGHNYRVTVDSRVPGQAWVKVERDTSGGGAYTTLLNSFDALSTNSAQQDSTGAKRVPDNLFLSLTSGTGGCNNIHEIDDMQVCALKLDNFSALIDHFQFYWDGAANTCQAEPVRVMACTDAACTSLYNGTITMTLGTANASSQWQDANGNALTGNQVTFSGGSVNLRLSQSSALTETLSVASSTPVARPLSVASCFNSTTGAQFANCNVAFAGTASFSFGTGATNVIGPLEAGVESGPLFIRANNSSCSGVPNAFKNKTVTVRFWFSYLDPLATTVSANIPSRPPAVWVDPYEAATNTTQMFWELPTAQASGVSKSVYFNSSGIGYFNLIYPDVGQLQISADVTSQNISGNSTFVVKPYQFDVSGVKRTADNVANAAATGPADGVFIRAGDPFTATVTAQNAAHKITDGSGTTAATPLTSPLTAYGRTTKMFGKEQIAEGVRVSSDSAVMQPAGGANPAIGNSDVPGSSFGTSSSTLGKATVTNFNWPEVGIIGLQPRILPVGTETTGDYLGAGDVTRYVSPNIGRFIPAVFAASGATLTNRNDLACTPASTFTYLDEPIGASFTLQAQARSGSITTNYAGAFAKLTLPGGAVANNNLAFAAAQPVVAAPATAFTALTGRLGTTGFAGAWPAVGAAGAGQVALTGNVTVSSLTNPGTNRVSPDGPFPSVQIGIAPDSNEGNDAGGTAMHVLMTSYDLDSDNSGGASGPDHRSLGTANLRFGQMQFIPGIGSERLPATIPAQILFWNGVAFVPNGADNCTSLPVGQLTLTKNLTSGDTSVTSGNLTFTAGKGNIRLAAPGVGSSGTVGVSGDLVAANLGYLLTRRGGAARYDQNPFATATFGLYKGANQIIHMREMY